MSQSTGNFSELNDRFSKHLSALKTYLKKQASSFGPEIRDEAGECVKPQGKYLRPMLTFACAPSFSSPTKSLVNRAATSELIHLSSLIHDDVIDNADLRRNRETVFKKFGTRTAILLGDAIFARAMEMAFEEKDEIVWRRAVEAVKTLCEGEVRQSLAKQKKVDFKKYISIIEQKTASLFEFACFMGASLESGSKSAWAKAAQNAGRHLGTAYQIYDDICDWAAPESESGKTAGTDFVFEKHTLPIIVLIEKLPQKKARELETTLHKCSQKELFDLIKKHGAIEESLRIFEKQIRLANSAVAKFPQKNAMLLDFGRELRALAARFA